MENCIYKINKNNGARGTGFFCKIPFNKNLLKVLITNHHVLKKNDIEDGKIIDIIIYNKEKKEELKKIKIDNTRKKFTDETLDVTIIEIRPDEDKINDYMEIDKEELEKEYNLTEVNYKRKSAYILHYPKGELRVSYGLINKLIEESKIIHYCNTDDGSSGSPILSLKNNKIIGVHYGSFGKKNYGSFIKNVIDKLNNYYNNNNNQNKNEINLLYNNNNEKETIIFGEKFVENNKNNIELIINGKERKLIKYIK